MKAKDQDNQEAPREEIIFVTFTIDGVNYKPIKLPAMEINHADTETIKSFKSVSVKTKSGKKTPYLVSIYISRNINIGKEDTDG